MTYVRCSLPLVAADNGSADPTLDNRANALAQAINKTCVQAMANPCTYVGRVVRNKLLACQGVFANLGVSASKTAANLVGGLKFGYDAVTFGYGLYQCTNF